MPDNSALVRAAMELRAVAPAMWVGFVGAMREYAEESQADMMRCAPEMLPRAQGMAIAAMEIAKVLGDAPAIYDKMTRPQGRPDARPTRTTAF
jgi:hypothetical protein